MGEVGNRSLRRLVVVLGLALGVLASCSTSTTTADGNGAADLVATTPAQSEPEPTAISDDDAEPEGEGEPESTSEVEASPAATTSNLDGAWVTGYGEIDLTITGNEVTGTTEGGFVEGQLDGLVLTGMWWGAASGESCAEERNGTTDWGLLRFDFDPSGETFDGQWGYCDGPVEFPWLGQRPGAPVDANRLDRLDVAGPRTVTPPLISATFAGDEAEVQRLIAAGENVDLRQEADGWTPLLVAAQEDEAGIVGFLLEAGAQLDLGSDDGFTALMIAAQHGHVEILESLLDAGANPRVARADNWTPLHSALVPDSVQPALLLLEAGSPLDAEYQGLTPLAFAAQDGLDAHARLLLDAGANVEGAPTDGPTPLLLAAQNGEGSTVTLLLDAGADPNSGGLNSAPLVQAASLNKVDTFGLLVEAGADVDARHRREEFTSLMWMANNDNLDGVLVLLELGADTSLTSEDGETARDIAIRLGHDEVAAAL